MLRMTAILMSWLQFFEDPGASAGAEGPEPRAPAAAAASQTRPGHQYNAFWGDQWSERDSGPCACKIEMGYLPPTCARHPAKWSLTMYQTVYLFCSSYVAEISRLPVNMFALGMHFIVYCFYRLA